MQFVKSQEMTRVFHHTVTPPPEAISVVQSEVQSRKLEKETSVAGPSPQNAPPSALLAPRLVDVQLTKVQFVTLQLPNAVIAPPRLKYLSILWTLHPLNVEPEMLLVEFADIAPPQAAFVPVCLTQQSEQSVSMTVHDNSAIAPP